ncbi:MAG TPA: ABC transporter permease [Rudaea sp.]|jgi:putative ABC transport system permease protein|nr:ABC transporter permease [Rudaea sp.]
MFDSRGKKILRDVWLYKSRTLLVAAAVAIGMIGAGALLDTWALVQRVTVQTYLASHPVSATLRVESFDDALLAQVRAMPDVAAARARRVVGAYVESGGTQVGAELFALQDWQAHDIGALKTERGTWPPRDGQIVIENSALEFSGAALNETLTLQVGKNPPRALPVVGVARDVGLPPGWMDHIVYAFVTPATLASLGASSDFDEIQIVVRDTSLSRDGVRRVAQAVKSDIERSGHRVTNIDVPEPMRHPHAAQMNSLLLTQGAFALLTLLVCALLIVNLITALLANQTKQIGVMKALGGSAGQIAAIYLGYALLLGVIASAVALPAALAAAYPYAALKAEMLNFPIVGVSVPWWAIALQFAVGCLLPVAAAAIPVSRACRLPVVAALQDPGIATDGLYVRRRIALPLVGRPLQLSIANAFRRRQRVMLTLLALATGGAVFLGADNLRESVRASVDRIFDGQRYDAAFRFADEYPSAALESVASNVDGIAHAQALASARVSVAHADGFTGDVFALVGMPTDSPLLAPLLDSGRWLNGADENALVVSRSLLKDEPSMHPGASIELTLGGKATSWNVVGVVESGPQLLAYAPLATFNARRGDERASQVVVQTMAHSAAMQLDTVARVRAEFERAGMPVASSLLTREVRRAFEDHLLMVVEFLSAMGWLMIAVGGMGLASTMSLAVLERTREIGVLRAIGARHPAIVAMIEAEGLVIAVLGWVAALPLSVPMSVALSSAFGEVMFSVPVRALPRLSGALGWLLLAAVVSLIACAMPARRATRISVAAALSYE